MKTTEEILKLIVNNTKVVKLHKQWGFYIETPFEAIHMIGLINEKNHYELSLYFGDTQQQSRAFYNLKPQIKKFNFSNWLVQPNFHLQNSFGENIIWFESKMENQDYIDFWSNNSQLLYKHLKSEVNTLLDKLEDKGIIMINNSKKQELKNILDKDYSAFNICAGFSLVFSISKDDVLSMEQNYQLKPFLIDKINYALSLIGESGNDFLNNNDYIDLPSEECGDPDGL